MLIRLKTKVGFAKGIMPKSTLQIFDLLQLTRSEKEQKAACQSLMKKLDAWKKAQREDNDPVLKFYTHVEGVLLRRQVEDAVMMYRAIRKERVREFQNYIERLPAQKSVFRSAS